MKVLAAMIRTWIVARESYREIARLEREIVAQRFFSYVRVGFDQRTMEFLPGHRIGRGKDLLEQKWRMVVFGGTPVLQIESGGAVICRLAPSENGAWHGCWLVYEKMDVQLKPIRDPHPDFPASAVKAAESFFHADGGASPAYEVLQYYRRTVADHPDDKRLLPVRSKTDAPLAFGRGVGQLSDEVFFSKLRDSATGRLYWAKRYSADFAKQLEWEIELYRVLSGRDARRVLPVDFTGQHGLIFDFDPVLFGGVAVHLYEVGVYLSRDDAAETRTFAETVVCHPSLGEMSMADLTDFQVIVTSGGLRFIDFSIKPKHWWML